MTADSWAAYTAANRRANDEYRRRMCPCGGIVTWYDYRRICDSCGQEKRP